MNEVQFIATTAFLARFSCLWLPFISTVKKFPAEKKFLRDEDVEETVGERLSQVFAKESMYDAIIALMRYIGI